MLQNTSGIPMKHYASVGGGEKSDKVPVMNTAAFVNKSQWSPPEWAERVCD